MIVRCAQGLGNRVAAIANGLSRSARVEMVWAVNEHCPVCHQEVFPAGIDGVTFSPGCGIWESSRCDGLGCEQWDAAGDRSRADAAYCRIMAAMAGEARPGASVAIAGRFFRNPDASAARLALLAAQATPMLRPVFVFADSRRAEIRRTLEALGVGAILPASPPLSGDLCRDRPGLLAYLSDWKTLVACMTIVAIDGPSSALHPARAAGRQIIYVPASLVQSDCSDLSRATATGS